MLIIRAHNFGDLLRQITVAIKRKTEYYCSLPASIREAIYIMHIWTNPAVLKPLNCQEVGAVHKYHLLSNLIRSIYIYSWWQVEYIIIVNLSPIGLFIWLLLDLHVIRVNISLFTGFFWNLIIFLRISIIIIIFFKYIHTFFYIFFRTRLLAKVEGFAYGDELSTG